MKNRTMTGGKSVHINPEIFQKVNAHGQRNLIRFRKDGEETNHFVPHLTFAYLCQGLYSVLYLRNLGITARIQQQFIFRRQMWQQET
jgi:hypothetical protein